MTEQHETGWDYDQDNRTWRPPRTAGTGAASNTLLSSFTTLQEIINAIIPVGVVVAYGAFSDLPTGWLWCDGSSFSATTYPQLAALLGGTTLPNAEGRVVAGYGAVVGFNGMFMTGGAYTHTLTDAEMPAHNHESELGFGNTTLDGDHTHFFHAGLGGGDVTLTPGINNYNILEEAKETDSGGDHTHVLATNGEDAAHNNIQPYITMAYIIKAA